MIELAYFGAAILIAYKVGSKGAGYGIAVFFAAVIVWQVAIDGPLSLMEPSGCDYGHAARDC